LTNFPDAEDVSRITGGVAISYAAVSIPLVAIGGGSARHHPEVNGVLGLRIAGWIGYGLTLADATALLVLSFDHPIDNWHVASVGLLGSTTAAAFAIDATISASQANSIRARSNGLTLHPGFGVARTSAREQVPLLTLQGTF
jgi:hypothetical protein